MKNAVCFLIFRRSYLFGLHTARGIWSSDATANR